MKVQTFNNRQSAITQDAKRVYLTHAGTCRSQGIPLNVQTYKDEATAVIAYSQRVQRIRKKITAGDISTGVNYDL